MADNFDLKEIFSCNYCNCVLKSPVILPCSESICQMHVEKMKTKDSSSQAIDCFFCEKEHCIPTDGFPKDMRTSKLIENKFHQMDLGNEHKKAIDSCKEMKKMIVRLENLTKETENFIHGYFEKVINKIDLLREEYKLKIDHWHQNCFNEIQNHKKECLSKLQRDPRDPVTKNSMISTFKLNLDFWQKKLKIPELSNKTYSFQSISSNVESSSLVLGDKFTALESEFLLENDYGLESLKKISVEDFPKIKIEKRVI